MKKAPRAHKVIKPAPAPKKELLNDGFSIVFGGRGAS